MGFMNSSSSFSRFYVLDPVPDSLWSELPDRLKKHAFSDIDDLPEKQAFGWVNFDDMLDSQWELSSPHKGSFFAFSLRLDTRRIPSGVIKKHLTLALRKEEKTNENNNKKYTSRERKKEIKDQVMLWLLKRFLPVPGEFNILWMPEKNEVWFASTECKMIDIFMEFFLITFDLHLEQLTPFSLASSMLNEIHQVSLEKIEPCNFSNQNSFQELQETPDLILGKEFLTWLWYLAEQNEKFEFLQSKEVQVFIEQKIVIQGGNGEGKEVASVSGALSPLREARFGLANGKKVTRALIRIEVDDLLFMFTLKADDFSISGIRMPKVEQDKDDDPDAILLEKIYLLETCINIFDSLYKVFLELRLGAKWHDELKKITSWISQG